MEIFALRVLWSVPLMVLLLWVTVTPFRVFKLLMDPKTFFWLFLSTACISTSWYLNTWGATNGQVLMVSLAFFLIPLISILIGVLFFRERLTPMQLVALILCASGFLYACLNLDSFPWLTVGIALAFGCYGIIKKQVKIDTLNGLAAEALLRLLAQRWGAGVAGDRDLAQARGRRLCELGPRFELRRNGRRQRAPPPREGLAPLRHRGCTHAGRGKIGRHTGDQGGDDGVAEAAHTVGRR